MKGSTGSSASSPTIYRKTGKLDETPIKFAPEKSQYADKALLFPGKVLADAKGNRLFISDTGHNRIIQTDLNGGHPVVIGDGGEGLVDGGFAKARFNRQQGMCLEGDTLYVADTENHAIRAIDLKAKKVVTLVGDGTQSQLDPRVPFEGPGKTSRISSPWDVIQVPGTRTIYIAMAGPHQIWKYDPISNVVRSWAGSGYENILDGDLLDARFAQPSGLATDGKSLFVADSEVSGVRIVTGLNEADPKVGRIVGEGLFEFGDRDGKGPEQVRLQHCLGLAYGDGRLFIADTYNNKVKACDPATATVTTFVGTTESGDTDDPPTFYQPGGLSVSRRQPVRRRHQQPQDQGRRPENQSRPDPGNPHPQAPGAAAVTGKRHHRIGNRFPLSPGRGRPERPGEGRGMHHGPRSLEPRFDLCVPKSQDPHPAFGHLLPREKADQNRTHKHENGLRLGSEAEADRQGVAERLAFLGGFQLVVLADGSQESPRRPRGLQDGRAPARGSGRPGRGRGRRRIGRSGRGRRWRRRSRGRRLYSRASSASAQRVGLLAAHDGVRQSVQAGRGPPAAPGTRARNRRARAVPAAFTKHARRAAP